MQAHIKQNKTFSHLYSTCMENGLVRLKNIMWNRLDLRGKKKKKACQETALATPRFISKQCLIAFFTEGPRNSPLQPTCMLK